MICPAFRYCLAPSLGTNQKSYSSSSFLKRVIVGMILVGSANINMVILLRLILNTAEVLLFGFRCLWRFTNALSLLKTLYFPAPRFSVRIGHFLLALMGTSGIRSLFYG